MVTVEDKSIRIQDQTGNWMMARFNKDIMSESVSYLSTR